MRKHLHLIGLVGSLRAHSYNRGLMEAARELLPEGLGLENFPLGIIPPYNEDVRVGGFPEPVAQLRQKIATADGILIATPEYNYSFPGILKNAIDWISRPPDQPFLDKPIAIMGASASLFGTVRAQMHLRQVFVTLDAKLLQRPEIIVPDATHKFDAEGRLTDTATRDLIRTWLVAFEKWIRRLTPCLAHPADHDRGTETLAARGALSHHA